MPLFSSNSATANQYQQQAGVSGSGAAQSGMGARAGSAQSNQGISLVITGAKLTNTGNVSNRSTSTSRGPVQQAPSSGGGGLLGGIFKNKKGKNAKPATSNSSSSATGASTGSGAVHPITSASGENALGSTVDASTNVSVVSNTLAPGYIDAVAAISHDSAVASDHIAMGALALAQQNAVHDSIAGGQNYSVSFSQLSPWVKVSLIGGSLVTLFLILKIVR